MNLNEVEKHVKFDLIFQLLIYIAIGLCLFLSLIVILATPAKAETISLDLTSYGVRSGQQCDTHPNNAFCAGQIVQGTSTNACGQGDGRCTMYMAYGTDNLVMSLNFGLNTSVHADSKVTITLKGPYFASGDYQCSTNVGTANNLGCRAIRTSSTSMNINFTSNSNPLSYPEFDVYQQTGNGFNPNRFFNITSIKLYETPLEDSSGGSSGGSSGSSFDDSGIINNANQNTSDIMQNADSNAHDTQNVIIAMNEKIMGQIGNLCPNRANWPNGEQNKIVINATHHDTVVETGQTINLTAGVKYYFSYERSCVGTCDNGDESPYDVILMYNSGYAYFIHNQHSGFQFTPEYSGSYELRVDCNINGDTCSYWNFYVGTIGHNYCPYGSYLSKLDDTNDELGAIRGGIQSTNDKVDDLKDTSQQTYDYLTDDTDPTVPSSDISNVMDSVQVSDPLNYLLVLPLNLLQKLNQVLSSNTCQRVVFGSLYGTEIYLPCINFANYLGSSVWNTIDLIVGVGLLAIILKRFYDSISNVLTLGKEKEVRDKLDLPTPMQFMASILGGGRD